MTKILTSVVWIGAGKMGQPILKHILQKGFPVTVFDQDPRALEKVKALGATPAESIASAVQNQSIIFTSLPNDAALLAVANQIDGVLENAKAGSIYVDTSTVSISASEQVANKAKEKGIHYLRSTVSGSPVTAESGKLTVMASGPQHAYQTVLPVLECFSGMRFYLGQTEEARLIKLVINSMIAVSAGMMAEALALGSKGGMDWQQMLEVMENSAVASPMVKYKTPVLKERDFQSTFSGIAMLKDIDLILNEAHRFEVPMPLTEHMKLMYKTLITHGMGEEDYIATVKLAESNSGLTQFKN